MWQFFKSILIKKQKKKKIYANQGTTNTYVKSRQSNYCTASYILPLELPLVLKGCRELKKNPLILQSKDIWELIAFPHHRFLNPSSGPCWKRLLSLTLDFKISHIIPGAFFFNVFRWPQQMSHFAEMLKTFIFIHLAYCTRSTTVH